MIENLSDETIGMICMLLAMFGMGVFWYVQYRALNETWQEEMKRHDEEWEKIYKESNENWQRLHEESEKDWRQTCNKINESWKNTCKKIVSEEVKEMSKRYIVPKRKHTKSRKYNDKCEGCGTPKPLS